MQIKYEWLSILISSSESSKSKGIHNINNMKTITIISGWGCIQKIWPDREREAELQGV